MDTRGAVMSELTKIDGIWRRYAEAYRRADAAGCAAIFTQDCLLMSPYGPVAEGRTAVAAQHAEWLGEGGADKVLEVVRSDQVGDLAWALVRFSEEGESGSSLNVMQRQPDGAWLVHICSLNEGGLPGAAS